MRTLDGGCNWHPDWLSAPPPPPPLQVPGFLSQQVRKKYNSVKKKIVACYQDQAISTCSCSPTVGPGANFRMEKNRKRPVLQVYLDKLRCISKEKSQTTLGNTELWFQLGIEDDAGTWLRETCWESGKRENQAARLPVFVWVGRMKKETWMVKILSRIKYHFLVLIAQKIISSLLWPLWQAAGA